MICNIHIQDDGHSYNRFGFITSMRIYSTIFLSIDKTCCSDICNNTSADVVHDAEIDAQCRDLHISWHSRPRAVIGLKNRHWLNVATRK